MLIDCPTCSRCYHVDPSELGGGRMVICPRCQNRWFAGAASPEPSRGHLLRLIGAVGGSPASPGAEPRREYRSPPTKRVGFVAAAAAACAVCLAILVVEGRDRLVKLVPAAAGLYAAVGLQVHSNGLDFAADASARRDPATSDVIISGEIRNHAKHRLPVPRLVYDIRDATGASLARWTESARSSAIPAGHVLVFASSPHHLPSASRTVLVKFETEGEAPGSAVARR